jgi:heme/copper-type cytochrome/quinol oxidase subunit 2
MHGLLKVKYLCAFDDIIIIIIIIIIIVSVRIVHGLWVMVQARRDGDESNSKHNIMICGTLSVVAV